MQVVTLPPDTFQSCWQFVYGAVLRSFAGAFAASWPGHLRSGPPGAQEPI